MIWYAYDIGDENDNPNGKRNNNTETTNNYCIQAQRNKTRYEWDSLQSGGMRYSLSSLLYHVFSHNSTNPLPPSLSPSHSLSIQTILSSIVRHCFVKIWLDPVFTVFAYNAPIH